MTWESFVDARRSYCLSVKCRVRAIFDSYRLMADVCRVVHSVAGRRDQGVLGEAGGSTFTSWVPSQWTTGSPRARSSTMRRSSLLQEFECRAVALLAADCL